MPRHPYKGYEQYTCMGINSREKERRKERGFIKRKKRMRTSKTLPTSKYLYVQKINSRPRYKTPVQDPDGCLIGKIISKLH